MSTISVVVPSLNDGEMLERCLQALAHQSRLADEIVVVDNGSDDNTVEVALRYGARVVYESVRGIPSATARGFDEAKMQIIARLDADSVPDVDWVERVVAHFEADEDLAAITGTGMFYGSKRWVHRTGERYYLGGYFWFFPFILGHPPLFGSNCAIRSSAWKRLEPEFQRQTPRVHDDLHLSLLMQPDMPVRYDPDLRVAVSARPLVDVRKLFRGAWWGLTTTRATYTSRLLVKRRIEHRNYKRALAREMVGQ